MTYNKSNSNPTFTYSDDTKNLNSRLDQLEKIWFSYLILGDSVKGPLSLKKLISEKTESLFREKEDLSLTNSKITEPLDIIVERQFPSTQVSIKGNFW